MPLSIDLQRSRCGCLQTEILQSVANITPDLRDAKRGVPEPGTLVCVGNEVFWICQKDVQARFPDSVLSSIQPGQIVGFPSRNPSTFRAILGLISGTATFAEILKETDNEFRRIIREDLIYFKLDDLLKPVVLDTPCDLIPYASEKTSEHPRLLHILPRGRFHTSKGSTRTCELMVMDNVGES